MKLYYIPRFPYSNDPLTSESHPERVLELYEKAQRNSGVMYVVSVPDGITQLVASKFSPRTRMPELTPRVIPLMAAIMTHQLDTILYGCDPHKPMHSWLSIYTDSAPHDILRKALEETYARKGITLIVEPIETAESKPTAPRLMGLGKK